MKRIKWIGDEQRLALQTDVAKKLRGRSDEAKWKFTYTRLFPEISPDNVPSPCKYFSSRSEYCLLTDSVFQDPVISIASFVVDQYEMRLRSEIREPNDLSDLESRVPTILGQLLAQYSIDPDTWNCDHPHGVQARITQLPSSRSRLSTEIELVAPLPTLDPPYDLGDTNLLQYGDFVLPMNDVSEEWAPQYDGLDNNGSGSHVLNFTDMETDPLGITFP